MEKAEPRFNKPGRRRGRRPAIITVTPARRILKAMNQAVTRLYVQENAEDSPNSQAA